MKSEIFIYRHQEELDLFRKAGKLAAQALQLACESVRPGITTAQLDVLTETWIRDHGAKPTFKGYLGFPCTLCTSVNHEVVHGISSQRITLKDGDIISIDVGVTLSGTIDGQVSQFIGDNAKTVGVGEIPDKVKSLIADTEFALLAGVQCCIPGNKISHIAAAIEKVALERRRGYVKEFGGHGIGPDYHSAPFIPNYLDYFHSFEDTVIQEGMVLAIEPMFTMGLSDIRKLKDGWTIVTKDNKLATHCEYSILVTAEGPENITLP